MSYIPIVRDRDSLPAINSARRINELEAELQAYRKRESAGRASPVSILKHDGSQSRRAIAELQDQVNSFREELKKKDGLIQHLVSLESAPKVPKPPDSYRMETLYLDERSVADSARSELAAMQVKFQRCQEKYREMENEIEAREIKIRELNSLLDASRNAESRMSEVQNALSARVAELESKAGSYETVANRGEYTISMLQREKAEASETIVQLEQRLRKQLEEREGFDARLMAEERRLNEVMKQIGSLLNAEEFYDTSKMSIDSVIRRLTDLVQENAMLKGKMVSLTEHLNETHLETKASRETIMRLVSEVGREQKVATKYTTDIENLRMERDNAVASQCELEREIALLRERVEANHRALEATKSELDLRDNQYSTLERDYRETSHTIRSASTQFELFREQVANLLSTAFYDVVPSEECIKDCVTKLMQDKKSLDSRVEEYENRVKQVTAQLEQELDVHKDMAQRCKRYEVETLDMAERLRIAEGELASGNVLRDGFKFDKEKYLRGLQKLGEIMKMDRISLDLGLDLTMDSLVVRAEQLVKLEAEALADKSTHVYSLQRKLKALREQLESKDLHIDLLRKKMTSLEERAHGRIDIEKQRDVDNLRVHKLEKLVEKYKIQLQDSRNEIQNLKAQLLGSSEIKVRTLEQRKDLEELAKQVEELEEVRKRQSRKISKLKSEVEMTETNKQETTLASENAVQALSSELRTTKNSLDNMKHREKQLVDFRTVVARMLGLDINTLAVPDYEIITRLEKLIQAHHTTAFTTLSLEEALSDVQDGSANDFYHALQATDPVIQRSRERTRRKLTKMRTTRARSLSPMKRDPKVY